MNHMQKTNPLGQGLSIFTKKKGGWHTHMNLMNFDQLHECGKIWQNNKSSCQNHLGFTYWGWRPDCEVLKYSLDHGFCIFFSTAIPRSCTTEREMLANNWQWRFLSDCISWTIVAQDDSELLQTIKATYGTMRTTCCRLWFRPFRQNDPGQSCEVFERPGGKYGQRSNSWCLFSQQCLCCTAWRFSRVVAKLKRKAPAMEYFNRDLLRTLVFQLDCTCHNQLRLWFLSLIIYIIWDFLGGYMGN